eukprot:g767.t1
MLDMALQLAPIIIGLTIRVLVRRDGADRVYRYAQIHNAGEEARIEVRPSRPMLPTYTGHRETAVDEDRQGPFVDVQYAAGPDHPFVIHSVRPDDTLEGILLRFRVRLAELKRWNAFPGAQYNACAELRIPKRLLPLDFVPKQR